MKKVSVLLIGYLMALSVCAQNSMSNVTIKVEGKRNKEVLVDGKSYAVNVSGDVNSNNNAAVVNAPITINDLQSGQHTLQLTRGNYNNNNMSTGNTVTFNLRSGYDLQITISNNGTIQQSETRKKRNWNSGTQYKTPMSAANFNVLLQSVKKEWRANTRTTLVTNAFANTANYFTTSQAKQLIQLINSQSSRLQLAKSSYRCITDPASFNQLYDLLATQSDKNELAAYVSVYGNNNSSNSTSYKIPMTDASFTVLYKDISNQWQAGAKMSAITNAFTNTNNYFSTYQAKQLIQLIDAESSRLSLAKLSYRSIADPANFTQLYDVLSSQASRNDLTAYVSSYSNGNPIYITPTRTPMTDASFNVLYRDVQSRFGFGAKMSALTDIFASTTNYFTTYQAKQLIQLVSDEDNRLTLAKSAYRNITDPANFEQINDIFVSQSNRNEMVLYVKTYNANNPGYNDGTYNTTKVAMSDANFYNLYSGIQNTFGVSAKLSGLTDAFANSSNYFTTAQAKQLIQLVSSETNRLQLAKSSYDNIVDPVNFSQLYDVLSSQSSRNELASYVSVYSYNR